MIDTNTRYLKYKDGLYRNGGACLPCDNCAIRSMCGAELTECPIMVPTLSFSDRFGTGGVFNTLRLGKAWSQRIHPGQLIALHDSDGVYGYAEVQQLYCGEFYPMMKTHAHANHLMLGKDFETAIAAMTEWFKKQYGPTVVKEATKITAVYLLRRDWSPDEALFEKLEETRIIKGSAKSTR